MRTSFGIRAAAVALALCACSSPSLHRQNRQQLDEALAELDTGSYGEAAQRLERLLTSTSAEAAAYGTQRFFAAYLLVRSHELAAYEGPFLFERSADSAFRLEGGPGDAVGSPTGHLVALAFHANAARTLYGSLTEAALLHEGEPLVPTPLERLGARNAVLHLNLSLLAVYSRLHFDQRCDHILSGMGEILDVERCLALLDEAEIDRAVRPWIFKAVFDYAKTRDEPLAFKFGVLARQHADDAGGSFTTALSDEIAHWITEASSYVFRSPAGQLFDPALPGCTVSGTPNIDFEAERRAEAAPAGR